MSDRRTPKSTADLIASALTATLISPNETDQNLEAANIVDAFYVLARSIHRLAAAIEKTDR